MNKNELLVGFLLTCALAPLIGWITVLVAPVCAYLWALSGMQDEPKYWRRAVVPALWVGSIFLQTGFGLVLFALPISFGALSVGYGIPDDTDPGSALGRFFWALTNGSVFWSNFLTRGVIYVGAVAPIYLICYLF